MGKGLQINFRQEEWVTILDLTGEITKSDEVAPEQILPPGNGVIALILNFLGVDYINSAGIALLIRVVRHAKENNAAVLAYGVSNHYQKIFQMVGLTQYMYLYPNETTALAAAGLLRQ